MAGVGEGVKEKNMECRGIRRRWERDQRDAAVRSSGRGKGKYFRWG